MALPSSAAPAILRVRADPWQATARCNSDDHAGSAGRPVGSNLGWADPLSSVRCL